MTNNNIASGTSGTSTCVRTHGDVCVDAKTGLVDILGIDSKITAGPACIMAEVNNVQVLCISPEKISTTVDFVPFQDDKINLGSERSAFNLLFVDDIILRSPNGSNFKVTVENNGTLSCKEWKGR